MVNLCIKLKFCFLRPIDVFEWFNPNGDELKMWCSEFDTLACRDHIHLARQAMRVNVLWKQPQLLRLHQQFDQIFQVRISAHSAVFV